MVDVATGLYWLRMRGDLQVDALRIQALDGDVEVLFERQLDDLAQPQLVDWTAGLLPCRRLAGGAAVLQRVEPGLIALQRVTDERVLRLRVALLREGAGGRQYETRENHYPSKMHLHGPFPCESDAYSSPWLLPRRSFSFWSNSFCSLTC